MNTMKYTISTILSITAASAYLLPFNLPEVQDVFALAPTPKVVAGDAIKVPYEDLPVVETGALQGLITLHALNKSAIELYEIANASVGQFGHPTRVIGSAGHWKTIDWILDELRSLREYYTFETQEFKALDGKVFNYSLSLNESLVEEVKPFQLTPPVHYLYGKLFAVKNNGCSEEDYEGIDPSTNPVALIERGVCSFGAKSSLAGKLGARAVLIYDNEPNKSLLSGTLGEPTKTTVATLGIQRVFALELLKSIATGAEIPVFVNVDSYVGLITTKNIIAETIYGDHDNVVALGAHSDSVEAGPGINDDGSGTVSLLTVAKELTKFKINNAVRFAWWAAEEEGLLGSNYYAAQLTPEENHKIRLFMDYDMMASPNYEYEVYNGSNTVNPTGSEEIKNLYIDYYESKGLNWTLIPFDGRSDYVGFIENGIPGGGIAAGAEKNNVFNGDVLDQCYHQLCDDLTNIAWDAFVINTQLIAHSVATYANDLSTFPERSNGTVGIKTSDAPMFKYRGSNLVI